MSTSIVPFYCLVAAAALIYAPFMVVAVARLQSGYDFSAPRAMFDKLPPHAQRAVWAHQNAFEAFPLFAAAVLMVFVTGRVSPWAVNLSIAFLVFRAAHSLFYIVDQPFIRSGAWALSMACIGSLMMIAIGL